MAESLAPRDEADLAAIVADAAARRSPLAVSGGGTKVGLGRPVQAAAELSTRHLTGITLYEPAELVVAARAGTPLAEVEAVLAAKGQRLAFEPPDWRGLFGSEGTPTIGAVAAANLSGPRRITVGAARDGLIGIRAVNGRGEVVKSGGRVMKNVTGLDLVKGLAGSFGTLAVLSEVSFKVLPSPETETTLVWRGLSDDDAIALLSRALRTPFEVTGAAHDPHAIGGAATYVRLEGFAASVADRTGRLPAAAEAPPPAEITRDAESAALWRAVREVAALAAGDGPIWRLSLRPADAPAVVSAIRHAFEAQALYDWGGGLVWLAAGAGRPNAGAGIVRAAIGAVGGHATLFRADAALRAAVEVFQPPAGPAMMLSRRLKQAFDPAGVLNPGRMYPGV